MGADAEAGKPTGSSKNEAEAEKKNDGGKTEDKKEDSAATLSEGDANKKEAQETRVPDSTDEKKGEAKTAESGGGGGGKTEAEKEKEASKDKKDGAEEATRALAEKGLISSDWIEAIFTSHVCMQCKRQLRVGSLRYVSSSFSSSSAPPPSPPPSRPPPLFLRSPSVCKILIAVPIATTVSSTSASKAAIFATHATSNTGTSTGRMRRPVRVISRTTGRESERKQT